MKLIQINTDHFIIADDSEIKEGDWMYNPEREPSLLQCIGKGSIRGWKKITHSTKPLELLSENGLSGMGFSKIRPLNVFEIKELIGEVDVEKKAEIIAKSLHDKSKHDDWSIYDQLVYEDKELIKLGYNQALEDNKEKKYTEKDIDKAYWAGMQFVGEDKGSFGEFIQSLQPKTEWEVEFVDGKFKLK